MKRFSFFAVLASVAFAGCTTNEVYEEMAKPQEIQFTAAPYSAQTRAEHDASQGFSGEGITVYAWKNGTETSYINGDNLTDNNGTWKLTTTKYWPNYALDFAAVSPVVGPGVSVSRQADGVTINYDFTSTPYTNNVNYMYADYVPNTTQYSGSVALMFRHALAKLKVCVKQGETHTTLGYPITVNVTSAKIVGIHDKGTFSVQYTNAGDNASVSKTSRVWQNTSGSDELSIISSATALNTVGVTTNGGYYVIPQTLGDGHKFVISYTVTIGDDIYTYEDKEVLLKGITLTQTAGSLPNGELEYSPSAAWGTNKSIIYTIIINSTEDLTNEITFTATEETWGDVEGEQTYNPAN